MFLHRAGDDARIDPHDDDEALEIEQQLHRLKHLDGFLGFAAVEIIDHDDHTPMITSQPSFQEFEIEPGFFHVTDLLGVVTFLDQLGDPVAHRGDGFVNHLHQSEQAARNDQKGRPLQNGQAVEGRWAERVGPRQCGHQHDAQC